MKGVSGGRRSSQLLGTGGRCSRVRWASVHGPRVGTRRHSPHRDARRDSCATWRPYQQDLHPRGKPRAPPSSRPSCFYLLAVARLPRHQPRVKGRSALAQPSGLPGIHVNFRITGSRGPINGGAVSQGAEGRRGIMAAPSAPLQGLVGDGLTGPIRQCGPALSPCQGSLALTWAVLRGGGRRGSHGDGARPGKRPSDPRAAGTSGRPRGRTLSRLRSGFGAAQAAGGRPAPTKPGSRRRAGCGRPRRHCQGRSHRPRSGDRACSRSLSEAVTRKEPANFSSVLERGTQPVTSLSHLGRRTAYRLPLQF